MPGLFVFLFALHLAAGLLATKPPKDGERHLTMVAFLVIVTTLVTKPWPPTGLPLLALFFAAYLQRAR